MGKSLKFIPVFIGDFSKERKDFFRNIASEVEQDYIGNKKIVCDLIVDGIGEFISQENKRRVGIEKKTDVLSFFVDENKNLIEGQIVLSVDATIQFDILVKHSILHILGYDHETDEEWKKMQDAEKLIFKIVEIKNNSGT